MKKLKIEITAGAFLFAAVCVLIVPLNWLAGWLIAAAFHEAGHIAVLKCLSVPVNGIRIGPFGAKITTGPMTPRQEILCAGAGPVSSFLLCSVGTHFPVLCMISFVQGLFNLIPVYPLDGGRMFRSAVLLIQDKLSARKIPCKEQDLRVQ